MRVVSNFGEREIHVVHVQDSQVAGPLSLDHTLILYIYITPTLVYLSPKLNTAHSPVLSKVLQNLT